MSREEHAACPSCGGAGGGPIGRAGSAWDTEDYVCPRCEGAGIVAIVDAGRSPGVAKAAKGTGGETGETSVPRKATG